MAIALIGFMGSGKTTIAQALASELGYQYIDTDKEIVKNHGEITKIFNQHGEEYFRDLESQQLYSINYHNNIVLATGGGIVLKNCNMQYLKQKFKIVWLKVALNDIIKRLKNDKTRPLFNSNVHQFKELFNNREILYELYADYIVENNELNKTISMVKNYVCNTLSK